MPLPPVPTTYNLVPATTPSQRNEAANSSTTGGRKRAYVVMKEEKESLNEEMAQLEAQLEALRKRLGLPTKEDKEELEKNRRVTTELKDHIHSGQLVLMKARNLLTREMNMHQLNPLSTFIHLTTDLEERRQMLRSIRDLKLSRAQHVANQTLHYLDHTKPYLSLEVFTSDDDCFHCHRYEITPYTNFKSARQLFDAVLSFHSNWEMTVSEMLDQLAIREDAADEFDPTIWNSSIVTVADDVGCLEEINTVFFSQFNEGNGGSPLGIMTHDSVDVDDLYPYRPHERTSKRGQAVYVVYEIPRPNEPTPLVVLKSCIFTTQLPPQVELAPGVEDRLRDNIARWPLTMGKFLRSFNSSG